MHTKQAALSFMGQCAQKIAKQNETKQKQVVQDNKTKLLALYC